MNKKIYIFIAFTFLLQAGIHAQNRSIQFIEKPWTEILQLAQKENKIIFMDAYAVWCGPCKWMSANIFTNDTVADFYNKNFICTKFDMEKGEGLSLRQLYQVRAYPSLLFINGDGELMHAKVGAARTIPDYITLGTIAMNPNERLEAYIKRQASGQLSGNDWITYFKRLSDAYVPVKDKVQAYFSSQPDKDLTNRINWTIILIYTDDINSREFKYLVKNSEKYSSLYGSDTVNGKISEVLMRYLGNYLRNPSFTEEKFESMKSDVRNSGVSEQIANEVIFQVEFQKNVTRGDVDGLYNLGVKDLEKTYGENPDMLNTMAWRIYSMTSEVKYLEQAEKWAKKSVSLKSEAQNNDTWANILFKLQRYQEAVKAGEKALESARQQNLPPAKYEENLKRYRAVTPGP